MKKNKIIKGYKGFNKGLKCRGFQYEEGKTYTTKKKIEICDHGFHFCENPLDVLDYYDLCGSEFAEVESIGKIDRDKKKIVTNKIKINCVVDLEKFIKISFEYLWKKCNIKNKKGKQASSGNWSQQASSGNGSQHIINGRKGVLVCSGRNSAFKGIKGTLFALTQYKQNKIGNYYPYKIISGKIDGKNIKENTWYHLKNNKIVKKEN